MSSSRWWARLAISAALAGLGGGCSLLVATGDLGGGASGSDDAGADGEAGGDALGDGGKILEASPPTDGPPVSELPSPLLYYYAFGDALDSSGRELHGTVHGDARVDAPGVRDSGLSCSGVAGDGFQFGGDFRPGTSSFTMTLFYKLASASTTEPNGGYNTLFSKGCQFENSNCDHKGFGLGIVAGAQTLVGYVQDQGGVTARYTSATFQSSSVIDADVHHVAFVVDRDARAVVLHVDGVERSRTSLLADYGSLDNSEWAGTLCTQIDDRWTMNGTIDEVMIFGRALTNTEIVALAGRR